MSRQTVARIASRGEGSQHGPFDALAIGTRRGIGMKASGMVTMGRSAPGCPQCDWLSGWRWVTESSKLSRNWGGSWLWPGFMCSEDWREKVASRLWLDACDVARRDSFLKAIAVSFWKEAAEKSWHNHLFIEQTWIEPTLSTRVQRSMRPTAALEELGV